jgi:hypothetical protein
MEVMPIPGTLMTTPVSPAKRIGQVRKGAQRPSSDEPDKPIPEPEPGTGEHIDMYV